MIQKLQKLLGLAAVAVLSCSQKVNAQVTTLTFSYTGAQQSFTIPNCTSPITISCLGASGSQGGTSGTGAQGGTGGLGGQAIGVLQPTAGMVLNIFVGGQGSLTAGGFNGGANGGNNLGGGGGGASDVRLGGLALLNRIITAGGGGGGGGGGCVSNTITGGSGGSGGGGNGANGLTSPNGGGGFGALAAAGGSAGIGCGGFLGTPGNGGVAGVGGVGGNGQTCCCTSTPSGGGGGGGDVGGGGGGGGSAGTVGCTGNDKGGGGGGAGGTSSVTPLLTSATTSAGVNNGNGVVTLMYIPVPSPTISLSPASPTVCNGSSVTITASGATTYSWSNGATTASVAVSPSVNTTYTVIGVLTNTAGSCSNNTVVSVSVFSTPVISASGPTAGICAGSSATLNASGANSYSWNTGATTASAVVSPTANTVYTVIGTNTLGCSSTSTVNVNVNAAPSLSVSSTSTLLCAGNTATITASGANTYSWSNGSTVSAVAVSPSATTVYTVVGTNTLGCSSAMTFTQNVSPCTKLQQLSQNNFMIDIYPNPSKGVFTIRYTGVNKDSRIEISDLQGKLISNIVNLKEETAVNITEHASGIYFVRVFEKDKEIFVTKIAKD